MMDINRIILIKKEKYKILLNYNHFKEIIIKGLSKIDNTLAYIDILQTVFQQCIQMFIR